MIPRNLIFVGVLSGLISAAVLWAAFMHVFQPYSDSDVGARIFQGSDFYPVKVGAGSVSGGDLVIAELLNGEAVLSRNLSLNASSYPYMIWRADFDRTSTDVYLFWNSRGESKAPHHIKLRTSGSSPFRINLSAVPAWEGELARLTLYVTGELGGSSFVLREVSLLPLGIGETVKQVFDEWISVPSWSQSSINRFGKEPEKQMVNPVHLALLWVLCSAMIFILICVCGRVIYCKARI